MTRRGGDFMCRGIQTIGPRGAVNPIPTPLLVHMRCHWCGDRGVTVTAATDRPDGKLARLYGWCDVAHARESGVVVPSGNARAK